MTHGHELKDRVTLVTGGTGGLGRSVVKSFVEAGAAVHVPVFDDSELPALGDHLGDALSAVTLHRAVDLTDAESVSALFESMPPPSILINLAGGFAMGPIEATDPRTWRRMIDLNATTAFLTSRAAFPAMREARFGRIVNVSALPAMDRGATNMTAYGAAKAAVLNLTHALAREGADHGITANAVIPSIIDTPDNRESMPGSDRSDWLAPVDIARVVLFLASAAGGVVTGAALPLQRGRSG
jgi:NAD(P)-dependent dehydrogenase (short-subunit alcohol dehydrogenase family)